MVNLLAILVAIISIFLGTVHAKWSKNQRIENYKNRIEKKDTSECNNLGAAKILKEIDKYRSYWNKVCP